MKKIVRAWMDTLGSHKWLSALSLVALALIGAGDAFHVPLETTVWINNRCVLELFSEQVYAVAFAALVLAIVIPVFKTYLRGAGPKMVAVLLAVSFLLPQNEAKAGQAPPPDTNKPNWIIECLVAGGVIVVGAIVYYNLNKFCKKKFGTKPPPPTNDTEVVSLALSRLTSHVVSTNDYYAAMFPLGQAPVTGSTDAETNVFEISGLISMTETGAVASFTGARHVDATEYTDFTGFTNWLSSYGIMGNGMTPVYGKNGVPTQATNVPITLVNGVITVNLSSEPVYKTILESSQDLANWLPVMTNAVPAGQPWVFSMNFARPDYAFYRYRLLAP